MSVDARDTGLPAGHGREGAVGRGKVPSGEPPLPGERFRAIFISDLHLGTTGCKAQALLEFLRAHESDALYLVGDIVDGWQLRRRWTWRADHNAVIQEVLRKSRDGCRVVFIPGNHDEAARQFDGLSFGGIRVENESEHVLLDGRRLWVVHGDLFDGVIQHARWVAYLGDQLYTTMLWVNHHFNRIRHRFGFSYWSLSQYLKHRVKDVVGFITDYERAMAHETRRRGYDGVVCGHIHKAEIRMIDGVLYCNDGDWVESLTALVETYSGRLMILEWRPAGRPEADDLPARVLETA